MLENIRRERFARYVVTGMSPRRAYVLAGYKFNAGNCYRMKADESVRARIDQLLEESFVADELTPDLMRRGLMKEAFTAKEGASRIRAWELLGKILGVFHADKPAAEMSETELVKAVQKAINADPKVRAAALEALGGSLPPDLANAETHGSA